MNYDLSVFRGDNAEFVFEIISDELDDSGNLVSSTSIDLTGYMCFFTAKRRDLDTDDRAVIQKTWSSHTDAVNGKTTLVLTPHDLAEAAQLVYDFGYFTPDDQKQTLFRGRFHITMNVTLLAGT